MNTTKKSKENEGEIPFIKAERKIVNIFDPSTYLKNPKINQKVEIPLIKDDKNKQKEEKEDEEDDGKFYTNKLARIVEEITKHRILIKLKKNIMSLVEGKIIIFSDLIKNLCSYNSFNYRINLDELNRDDLERILDFLDIIEWNKSRFMWENKEEELNKWYNSLDNISDIEEVCFFIFYIFLYIYVFKI